MPVNIYPESPGSSIAISGLTAPSVSASGDTITGTAQSNSSAATYTLELDINGTWTQEATGVSWSTLTSGYQLSGVASGTYNYRLYATYLGLTGFHSTGTVTVTPGGSLGFVEPWDSHPTWDATMATPGTSSGYANEAWVADGDTNIPTGWDAISYWGGSSPKLMEISNTPADRSGSGKSLIITRESKPSGSTTWGGDVEFAKNYYGKGVTGSSGDAFSQAYIEFWVKFPLSFDVYSQTKIVRIAHYSNPSVRSASYWGGLNMGFAWDFDRQGTSGLRNLIHINATDGIVDLGTFSSAPTTGSGTGGALAGGDKFISSSGQGGSTFLGSFASAPTTGSGTGGALVAGDYYTNTTPKSVRGRYEVWDGSQWVLRDGHQYIYDVTDGWYIGGAGWGNPFPITHSELNWNSNYRDNNSSFVTSPYYIGLSGTVDNAPNLTDYANGGVIPNDNTLIVTSANVFGDTWNKLAFYVELNSAPGAQDGKFYQWLNDSIIYGDDTFPWIQRNGDPAAKFNSIKWGGNSWWQSGTGGAYDSYQIDDILIQDNVPSNLPTKGNLV